MCREMKLGSQDIRAEKMSENVDVKYFTQVKDTIRGGLGRKHKHLNIFHIKGR
jgi:hypothetical protein